MNRLSIGGVATQFVKEFDRSKKKEAVILRNFKDPKTKKDIQISLRLIRGPQLKDGSTLILATNLMDKRRYRRKDLVKLYAKRWEAEKLYAKVKTLLQLDKFHSRKLNGIYQEIFANLFVISLTTVAVIQAQMETKTPSDRSAPNFKNAIEVTRKYLYVFLAWGLSRKEFHQLFSEMIRKIKRIVCKKQPNRSYPRYSRRPLNHWPMAKKSKIKAHQLGRRADASAEMRAKYKRLDEIPKSPNA